MNTHNLIGTFPTLLPHTPPSYRFSRTLPLCIHSQYLTYPSINHPPYCSYPPIIHPPVLFLPSHNSFPNACLPSHHISTNAAYPHGSSSPYNTSIILSLSTPGMASQAAVHLLSVISSINHSFSLL